VWHGVYHLVSHRLPPGAWPHVIWLLPLHWMGGHYILPARRLHPHLLIRVLLLPLPPGQQPFLLLQTGRWQPASRLFHQSCQKRPRLRLERFLILRGCVGGLCSVYRDICRKANNCLYSYSIRSQLHYNLDWRRKRYIGTLHSCWIILNDHTYIRSTNFPTKKKKTVLLEFYFCPAELFSQPPHVGCGMDSPHFYIIVQSSEQLPEWKPCLPRHSMSLLFFYHVPKR